MAKNVQYMSRIMGGALMNTKLLLLADVVPSLLMRLLVEQSEQNSQSAANQDVVNLLTQTLCC